MNGLEWLVLVAAALAAVVYIWRTVMRPLWRLIHLMETTVPVVFEIAQEFKNNGGTSLKDVIDRLGSTLDAQVKRLDGFEEYVEGRFHDVTGQISTLKVQRRVEE